jgi:DNA invertase Pin-like site-specific DNA recombinase
MGCDYCGKPFKSRTRKQRYCGYRCREKHYRSGNWWPTTALPVHPFVTLYNEGHRIADIARAHGMSRQNVSQVIERGRKKGQISDVTERAQNPCKSSCTT